MVSDLHKLSTNFVRESRRKKNCVRKVDINGSQVARNALYKSAGRGEKKDETISFRSIGQLGRPPDLGSGSRRFKSCYSDCGFGRIGYALDCGSRLCGFKSRRSPSKIYLIFQKIFGIIFI